jgi:hypothetical protein
MKRFSIRDVFWLVLVVAMGCGWWLEHRWQERLIDKLREFVVEWELSHDEEILGSVYWSDQ